MSKTPSLTVDQQDDLCQAVLALAEKALPSRYFLLSVTIEGPKYRPQLCVDVDVTEPAGTVSLEDCRLVSHILEPLIDEQLAILKNQPYELQVRSPGVGRELTTPREFAFYTGRIVALEPASGKAFEAQLQHFDVTTQHLTLCPMDGQAPDTLAWEPQQLRVTLGLGQQAINQEELVR